MASNNLTVIPSNREDHGARALSLFTDAQHEAGAHMQNTLVTLRDTAKMLSAIEAGGGLYPAGVREEARQLSERLRVGLERLNQISSR